MGPILAIVRYVLNHSRLIGGGLFCTKNQLFIVQISFFVNVHFHKYAEYHVATYASDLNSTLRLLL